MPVLLAKRKPDNVAGADFLDRSTLALQPAEAGCDDKGLVERMGVPHGAGAGLECLLTAADTGGSLPETGVHAGRTGEPSLGGFARRPRAERLVANDSAAPAK